MTSGGRPFLSIGEVLSLLRDEFPDITISKIRFLESQGLLDPERTPSGYRKFYPADVERLRWILQQQREHFLPLKVIRGRLDDAVPAPAVEPAPAAVEPPPAPPGPEPTASPSAASEPVPAPPEPPRPAPVTRARSGEQPPAGGGTGGGVSLTADDVAEATGVAVERLRELERFGLIAGRPVAGTTYYDDDAVAVAAAASGFLDHGIEARHLRMYKNACDRESGFFEQVVTPLLKQRNPQAKRRAVETLQQLVEHGDRLRGALVRQALRDLLGP